MNPVDLPWTVWLAFVLALLVSWVLERRVRGRVFHGILSLCSLAAAFAVHKLLQPWESSSVWLKGLLAFLVFLTTIESSQAILKDSNRSAT